MVLLLPLAVAGCSESEPAATASRPEAAAAPLPERVFYDYRVIESEEGVREYVLDSDRMEKFPGLDELHLVRVHMDFYQDGAPFSTLTSDSGRANPVTKDIFVWGHVTIVTNDGKRLETEELTYDSASGLIRNDIFNTLDQGQDIVTGYGLEATPDLKYTKLLREVEAIVGDETVEGME